MAAVGSRSRAYAGTRCSSTLKITPRRRRSGRRTQGDGVMRRLVPASPSTASGRASSIRRPRCLGKTVPPRVFKATDDAWNRSSLVTTSMSKAGSDPGRWSELADQRFRPPEAQQKLPRLSRTGICTWKMTEEDQRREIGNPVPGGPPRSRSTTSRFCRACEVPSDIRSIAGIRDQAAS